MKKITLLIALMITSFGFSQNLITNGNFEGGVTGWSGNAANVVTESGNSYNSANVLTAGNAYEVNLSYVLPLTTQGKAYKLTFTAWSDRNRTLIAGIGLNQDPWTAVVQTVNLTSTAQTFVLNFISNFANANSRIIFDMGAAVGFVGIDNVILEEVVTTCNNGIKDGDETGVDCGGSCAPCIVTPTVAAPNPPARLATDVVSIYSDVYSNIIVSNFDAGWNRVKNIGSDGKLIFDANGNVLHVNFTEKLLAMLLAKLSNFIPEAGIWLNTQRPEWNDANNALVGNGVSMVTLYHIRRLQSFCLELFKETATEKIEVSEEISTFFISIFKTFDQYKDVLTADISDANRRLIADGLGNSGSDYREKIYGKGFSGSKKTINVSELIAFFELTIKHFDHSIQKNKREDNLYHSYNLISFKEKSVSIRHLYEMLEGQVAILNACVLNTEEVNEVLDALKSSAMFRTDQYSYMLYPDRQLPRFTEKNNIPSDLVQNSKLLMQLISENNSDIIYKDIDGVYHFNSKFRNAADLNDGINGLKIHQDLIQEEKQQILDVFEKVFDHQSFTGRSGTFYGFEGLGCIYWHMVSKLLLAISENYFLALKNTTDQVQLGRLVQHYYDVRAGIGFNKSPELFGAFPTDAYSHTPGNSGAKQPGMTGQVKEDIISRLGELGIAVEQGKIIFNPGLLRKSEFLTTSNKFDYVSIQKSKESIDLQANSLAFTFCQVPFVFHVSEKNSVKITNTNGTTSQSEGLSIDEINSKEIFERTSVIKQVDVYLTPRLV